MFGTSSSSGRHPIVVSHRPLLTLTLQQLQQLQQRLHEMAGSSNHEDLIQALHEFCKEATRERDVSHGWEHMDKVQENSLRIWETEKLNYLRNATDEENPYDVEHMTKLIIAVSQLHDVADHKYGKTVEQLEGVRKELEKHFSDDDVGLIQSIIDNISFSKEAKRRMEGDIPSWEELGREGKVVRNVCSDADKIEALGMIGIKRCMQYSAETCCKKGMSDQVTPDLLIQHLIDHGKEKLFILFDQYVVTEGGKALGRPSHVKMMQEAEKLQQFLSDSREMLNETEKRKNLESFEGGRILLDVLDNL